MQYRYVILLILAFSLISASIGREMGRRAAAAKYYAEMQDALDSLILKHAQSKADTGMNFDRR